MHPARAKRWLRRTGQEVNPRKREKAKAWALLRARPPQPGAASVSALRAQVEYLAHSQGALHQAITAVQSTLSDLQASLVETGAGIKDHLARDLQEARRAIDEVRTTQAVRHRMEEDLRQLPPSMVEQGYRVNGKIVEFTLVHPAGRRHRR
jgi:hypothetical protein